MLTLFMPERAYFEPEALDFSLGQQIHTLLAGKKIPITIIPSHNRVTGIPGKTPQESYFNAKKTLVVGIKKGLRFEPCRPSADYQFPLGTSCPGGCEYCYLQTTLGKKPYIRIYVNLEQIYDSIQQHIQSNLPNTTMFEVSSTADPVAVEHLTGSLYKTIEFFGTQPDGRLRVVTKFTNIESLLNCHHQGHTRFRFSINTDYVLQRFEHQTSSLSARLAAANKMQRAGYPLGFIIAPLIIYDGWERDYKQLLARVRDHLDHPDDPSLTFELISHRFTKAAKNIIRERFPNTKLDLDENNRRTKYGKFGYVKYIYPQEQFQQLETTMREEISRFFPHGTIEYFT